MDGIHFAKDIMFPVLGISVMVLLSILAWLSTRLYSRVDSIPSELEKINETLHKIEVDLRRELAVHDARISVVETKVAMFHHIKE